MYDSHVTTATIRDLRTRFPRIRRLVDENGEVIVTHRGRPVIVLRPWSEEAPAAAPSVDYFARLRRRMPRPLSGRVRKALDEENRGER
jgi:antitoxin (DNA-binding transcriptional repressor) of toxin-antitoxin stability system